MCSIRTTATVLATCSSMKEGIVKINMYRKIMEEVEVRVQQGIGWRVGRLKLEAARNYAAEKMNANSIFFHHQQTASHIW